MGRRRFLKIIAASGAAGLGTVPLWRWLSASRPLPVVRETRLLMGTIINLALITPDEAAGRAAVTATLDEMARWVALLDHRQPASALGRLNADGVLDPAPPELLEVVAAALEMGALTGGAFDVTVKPVLDAYRAGATDVEALRPLVDYRQVTVQDGSVRLGWPGMALTLDGLAKGRVVDAGMAALRAQGYDRVLVEAGGDLLAGGAPHDGRGWQVGLQSPRGGGLGQAALTVSVQQQALATSGDYQHAFTADFSLHHILDPRTLRSPAALASATALAPTAMQADALSTACLVLGPEAGLALVERLPGCAALLIDKDLRVYRSAGFPASG
jgi:thiamine biosynthesis lipoprotein